MARFAFIEVLKEEWPVEFLFSIMQVTSRVFCAWRERPISQRQYPSYACKLHCLAVHDMVLWAHTHERLRMTEELQELNLTVGLYRIDRLMRENDIKIIRTQKYKATTDSNHTLNIGPNLLDQDFSADVSNQRWAGDISYIWTSES